jgi:magnesium transporter
MIEIFVHRNGSGKVESDIAIADLPQILARTENFVWIDLEKPTADEEEQILARTFNFHPLTIEDCRLNHSQPKAEEFPDYLYFIVHGVRPEATNVKDFETKELDGYIGKNFVITYHHENFRSVDAVKQHVRASPIACQRGASYLLHQILDQIVDFYLPVIDDFENYIIELEDRIFELKQADNKMLAEIVALKRTVIRLRRVSSKQLNVLYRIAHGEFPQIDEQMLPFYRDVYDHLLRVSDLAESYRDLMGGLMETYLSVISNRTNEVMKTLTIFSAIMLPLSVIAGIYGMNFENMPELRTRSGYYVVLGVMGLVAALMLFYFWRKGWLSASSDERASPRRVPRLSRKRKKAKSNNDQTVS